MIIQVGKLQIRSSARAQQGCRLSAELDNTEMKQKIDNQVWSREE